MISKRNPPGERKEMGDSYWHLKPIINVLRYLQLWDFLGRCVHSWELAALGCGTAEKTKGSRELAGLGIRSSAYTLPFRSTLISFP